jgi:UDP-3-O-[3-hydroxymyristoyl] glucosamine N-acyltransferase
MKVKDLAAFLGAPFEGDGECETLRVAPFDEAEAGDVSFLQGRALAQAGASRASCLIVPLDFPNESQRTVIRAANPRAAAARVIAKLHPPDAPRMGIHPTAVIGPGSVIANTAFVGPLVSIGSGVRIGEHSSIGAGSVIGDNVCIGEGCTIHSRVTIYRDVILGAHVILHSGCVIGADGFGFVLNDGVYEKFPQVGRVEIGSRVEIGANTCIDRAALGVTSIGDGTKLDNLVHIGHNCRIGRHVVIAAQTGLSGGVVVGDYAVIGGQVGIGDKARIESRAVLGSGSGVLTSKIVRAGEVMWGTPARPLREYLKQLAVLSKLAKRRT